MLFLAVIILAFSCDANAFDGRLTNRYALDLQKASFKLESSTDKFEDWKLKTKNGDIKVQIQFLKNKAIRLMTITEYSYPYHDGFSIGKSIFYPEPWGADSLERKIIDRSNYFFKDSLVHITLKALFGKAEMDMEKLHSEAMAKGVARKRAEEIRRARMVKDGYGITKIDFGEKYQMVFAVGDGSTNLQFSPKNNKPGKTD